MAQLSDNPVARAAADKRSRRLYNITIETTGVTYASQGVEQTAAHLGLAVTTFKQRISAGAGQFVHRSQPRLLVVDTENLAPREQSQPTPKPVAKSKVAKGRPRKHISDASNFYD